MAQTETMAPTDTASAAPASNPANSIGTATGVRTYLDGIAIAFWCAACVWLLVGAALAFYANLLLTHPDYLYPYGHDALAYGYPRVAPLVNNVLLFGFGANVLFACIMQFGQRGFGSRMQLRSWISVFLLLWQLIFALGLGRSRVSAVATLTSIRSSIWATSRCWDASSASDRLDRPALAISRD
ncbi:MAG: hypothetical protein AAFP69_15370, partial [Planctomycetota bacterium]